MQIFRDYETVAVFNTLSLNPPLSGVQRNSRNNSLLTCHFARAFISGDAAVRVITKRAVASDVPYSPWIPFSRETHPRRSCSRDHRVNKNNRLSGTRGGYLSTVENAFIWPPAAAKWRSAWITLESRGWGGGRGEDEGETSLPSSPGGNYRR